MWRFIVPEAEGVRFWRKSFAAQGKCLFLVIILIVSARFTSASWRSQSITLL
jgi:hypothetical protein